MEAFGRELEVFPVDLHRAVVPEKEQDGLKFRLLNYVKAETFDKFENPPLYGHDNHPLIVGNAMF